MTQTTNQRTDNLADLVHEKSAEILSEVGFCVPDPAALARLESADFPADHESQMVRVTPDLLQTALVTLNVVSTNLIKKWNGLPISGKRDLYEQGDPYDRK